MKEKQLQLQLLREGGCNTQLLKNDISHISATISSSVPLVCNTISTTNYVFTYYIEEVTYYMKFIHKKYDSAF